MALSAAKIKNLLDGARPGEKSPPPSDGRDEPEAPLLKGLQLSEIVLKPLEWFRYNPDNQLFRDCKTPEYFAALKKDIREANTIIEPLVAMPDGLLVEGESRHIIAGELAGEGLPGFTRIPCRIIQSKISKAKIRERLYLGNLSRFEIPHEAKLVAYAEIWPDYFFGSADGRLGNSVTTKKTIAAATGLSESQIKRDRAVIRKAAEIAGKERKPLSAGHIKQVQSDNKKAPVKKTGPDMGYMPSGAVSLPDSARFLKAAVIVLVESNEESAARLLINHFLKKAEKTAFLDRLPKNIVKSLKITREKS